MCDRVSAPIYVSTLLEILAENSPKSPRAEEVPRVSTLLEILGVALISNPVFVVVDVSTLLEILAFVLATAFFKR